MPSKPGQVSFGSSGLATGSHLAGELLSDRAGVELLHVRPEEADAGQPSVARVRVEYRRLDAPDSSSLANVNQAIIDTNGVVRDIVRG